MGFAVFHLALVFSLSALLTFAAIIYARIVGMLDAAGQRRSHTLPTPRGGGIGIVLLFAVSLAWLYSRGEPWAGLCLGAVCLVAVVGFIDDHRGLGAMPRLVAHLLSALTVSIALPMADGHALQIALALLFVVAITWSINLYNFMDGINGLAAGHAALAFAGLAWLSFVLGAIEVSGLSALVAAASLGFLPFNAPRARVFMGDVASGSLGLILAILGMRLIQHTPHAWALLVMLHSAFIIDASLTLVMRMLLGRRWYSAHREHLYQWLVRSGWPHWRASAAYASWTLVMIALCAVVVDTPVLAQALVPVVLGSGALIWLYARRTLRSRVRARA